MSVIADQQPTEPEDDSPANGSSMRGAPEWIRAWKDAPPILLTLAAAIYSIGWIVRNYSIEKLGVGHLDVSRESCVTVGLLVATVFPIGALGLYLIHLGDSKNKSTQAIGNWIMIAMGFLCVAGVLVNVVPFLKDAAPLPGCISLCITSLLFCRATCNVSVDFEVRIWSRLAYCSALGFWVFFVVDTIDLLPPTFGGNRGEPVCIHLAAETFPAALIVSESDAIVVQPLIAGKIGQLRRYSLSDVKYIEHRENFEKDSQTTSGCSCDAPSNPSMPSAPSTPTTAKRSLSQPQTPPAAQASPR